MRAAPWYRASLSGESRACGERRARELRFAEWRLRVGHTARRATPGVQSGRKFGPIAHRRAPTAPDSSACCGRISPCGSWPRPRCPPTRGTRSGRRGKGSLAGRDGSRPRISRDVLQEQVARSVEGFVRTLGLIKIVVRERAWRHQARRAHRFAATPRAIRRSSASCGATTATAGSPTHRSRSDARAPVGGGLPWFIAARARRDGRIVIGEPTQGRVSGPQAIPMAVRLDTESGEFDGVLVTALDPERLVHLFRAIRVGERSVVGLMDREGLLYAWSSATDPLPPGAASPEVPRSAETITGDQAPEAAGRGRSGGRGRALRRAGHGARRFAALSQAAARSATGASPSTSPASRC